MMRQIFIAILTVVVHHCSYAQLRGQILKIDDIHVATVHPYFDDCFSQQEKENWCWAACIQMVLKYQGVRVSQSDIAKRTLGNVQNTTVNGYDIIQSINGWNIGQHQIVAGQDYVKDLHRLTNDLAYKYPVIIGMGNKAGNEGHAVVLTHLYFKTDHRGNIIPFKVICIDPAKSYNREKVYDWDDFYQQINTIIHVYTK